jgi:hypothetical protein
MGISVNRNQNGYKESAKILLENTNRIQLELPDKENEDENR